MNNSKRGLSVRTTLWTVTLVLTLGLLGADRATADSLDTLSSYDPEETGSQSSRMRHYLKWSNHTYSLRHLAKARAYRTEGRYELARQGYLQALSLCSDNHTLDVIKRELEGVELLLRTMR